MKKATISPMISLDPVSGGGLSASPVNSTWMPGRFAGGTHLILEIDHVVRGSWNPSRSNCASKKATRLLPESCPESGASGSLIEPAFVRVLVQRPLAVGRDCTILATAALRSGVSSDSPGERP